MESLEKRLAHACSCPTVLRPATRPGRRRSAQGGVDDGEEAHLHTFMPNRNVAAPAGSGVLVIRFYRRFRLVLFDDTRTHEANKPRCREGGA